MYTRFCLEYFGINLVDSLYCDVMLLKHLCDEDRPFDLKGIAKKVFGASEADEQTALKQSIKSNGGSSNSNRAIVIEIQTVVAVVMVIVLVILIAVVLLIVIVVILRVVLIVGNTSSN